MTCLKPVCPPPKSKSLVSAVIDEVYAQDSTLRLIEPSEEARWERLVQKHHYLKKATMVGETLRYVVERKGRWVALLGWSSAASCPGTIGSVGATPSAKAVATLSLAMRASSSSKRVVVATSWLPASSVRIWPA